MHPEAPPCTCSAPKRAPCRKLPWPLAVAIATDGILPDGQQDLCANVIEHVVLALERHGRARSAGGHEGVLECLNNLGGLVGTRLLIREGDNRWGQSKGHAKACLVLCRSP